MPPTASATAIARGWSAADVAPDEYVDDAWIAEFTAPAKPPSRLRAAGGRLLTAVRTIGVDPLEGLDPAEAIAASPILGALPRTVRRTLIQRGGLTREQMRQIARMTGYPIVEAWSGHNAGPMKAVWGALCHHTGTPRTIAGDYPTLRVVRDGRPGLVNSLSAFGLGKSGTIYLISPLTSWHAGTGEYNGLTDGNGYLAGIEAESDGTGWTPQQVDAYPRLVAAILVVIKQDDRWTTRHASWALPRGRKTDFAGWPGGTDPFWAQVYAYLRNPASIHVNYGKAPAPAPAPPAAATTHTVKAGDTLWAIATWYRVSVAQLKTWNGLTSDVLAVGKVLRVKAPAAPAPSAPRNTLPLGGRLLPGQSLVDGAWSLAMQGDGNLVVYRSGVAQWSTRTAGNKGASLVLQADGNLVLYSAAGRPLWASSTVGKGHHLVMQGTDGNLVLYSATNRPVWSRR